MLPLFIKRITSVQADVYFYEKLSFVGNALGSIS